MQVNPYLTFNGNCREAFEFYAEILGGEVDGFITHADMPSSGVEPGSEWADKVLHGQIIVNDRFIMGSDAPQGYYFTPQGVHVQLEIPTAEEAERVWNRLSDSATVVMALQETEWAHRFGMLTDRFGIPWILNVGKPM